MKIIIVTVKRGTAVLAVAMSCIVVASAQSPVGPAATGSSSKLSAAQASYAFGITLGEQLRRSGVSATVSLEDISRGVGDALAGKKLAPAEQQQLAEYVRAVQSDAAERNKATAADYLIRNAKADGVRTSPSGLQYRIVARGNAKAASPRPDDLVTVQYRGKLLDGTEFDSSYARGEPANLQPDHLIKGWQEALSMMKPGSKWQLFVPPELGYGMNSPSGIPPGSLLIFDLELLAVKSNTPPAAVKRGSDDHHDDDE